MSDSADPTGVQDKQSSVPLQGIVKAGVCAHTDAHKIARDFGVTVEGVAELTDHPIVRTQEGLQSRSLASESPLPFPYSARQEGLQS